MRDLRTIQLVREVARIADDGRELDAGLRASGVPGAVDLADRLAAGEDLVSAMSVLVGPRLGASFAADGPGLGPAAVLAYQDLSLARERRHSLAERLAYPGLCLLALLGLMVWLHHAHEVVLEGAWWWPVAAPLLVGLLLLAPLPAGRRWGPFGGWHRHACLAGRYARAAVAASWRLSEDQCRPLFGRDLGAVLPYLGQRGAEETCRRLAEHHRQAALRAARRLGITLMALLYLSAAGIALSAAIGIWSQLGHEMELSIEEVDEPELWDLRR